MPSPRICAVIGRTRHRMVLAEMEEAAARGADLAEIRLDFISQAPDLKRFLAAKKHLELIATARRPADGGRFGGSEAARKILLRQCIADGFDWVDLETDIADEIRRFKNVKRIVSYHNMKTVPDDLEDIYAKMCAQDADVIKIAVMGKTLPDNKRLIDLVRNAPKPTIAFCMGEIGIPSRLIGAAMGAPFIYAAFNKERIITPGMPTYTDAKSSYRLERVQPGAQIFAVVGDPIGHSFSPLVHNAAFAKLGINALYIPIWVPKGHLAECLKVFRGIVDGYSVTIPHKEAAAHEANARDDAVVETHSANTLVRIYAPGEDPGGTVFDPTTTQSRHLGFKAYNTDAKALMDALVANLPRDANGAPPDLHKWPVLILGAGGLARTAAHALAKVHCTLWIASRTHERAEKLAKEVGGEPLDWKARHKEGCRIVINCTPIGMHPNVDESPLHNSYLRPDLIVFESVYVPETTLLVKEARARGATVITGVDMFIRQASTQFELFTGREAPVDTIAKAIRRKLSPVQLPADE
ncbi:MAG: type I 3-dehydroquinate dehydratase [Gemmataceae bacterium]